MKTAAKILLGILSVLYPLLWYYGREQGWFYPLAGFMLLLWLARAAMQRDSGQRRVSLLVAAFFAAVLLFRRPDSMYWYPVWVNGLLLLLFGLSLTQKQSLHPPRYPNLVRLFCPQRQPRRPPRAARTIPLVGTLHRHHRLHPDGHPDGRRIRLPQMGIKAESENFGQTPYRLNEVIQ